MEIDWLPSPVTPSAVVPGELTANDDKVQSTIGSVSIRLCSMLLLLLTGIGPVVWPPPPPPVDDEELDDVAPIKLPCFLLAKPPHSLEARPKVLITKAATDKTNKHKPSTTKTVVQMPLDELNDELAGVRSKGFTCPDSDPIITSLLLLLLLLMLSPLSDGFIISLEKSSYGC